MAYNPTNWVDGENNYNITDQDGNVIYSNIKLAYSGAAGTPVSAANMNNMEQGIASGLDKTALLGMALSNEVQRADTTEYTGTTMTKEYVVRVGGRYRLTLSIKTSNNTGATRYLYVTTPNGQLTFTYTAATYVTASFDLLPLPPGSYIKITTTVTEVTASIKDITFKGTLTAVDSNVVVQI